jgi:hypothetical protein
MRGEHPLEHPLQGPEAGSVPRSPAGAAAIPTMQQEQQHGSLVSSNDALVAQSQQQLAVAGDARPHARWPWRRAVGLDALLPQCTRPPHHPLTPPDAGLPHCQVYGRYGGD